MTRMNALWNCKNPHQGDMKKILCVCSAGLLRSPSIAHHLAMHGYNTRAAGVHDYALIQVDDVLIEWADEIICAETEHMLQIIQRWPKLKKKVSALEIPDQYQTRDPKLMEIIHNVCKDRGYY